MLISPRKLKLLNFGWYFVVLTRGFYSTALTTYPSRHCSVQNSSGKQNRGKLASCMCQRGQKHCSSKKTKKKEWKEIQHVQAGETEIVAYFARLPDRLHTSESCACPRDCGRFSVGIGGRTQRHTHTHTHRRVSGLQTKIKYKFNKKCQRISPCRKLADNT